MSDAEAARRQELWERSGRLESAHADMSLDTTLKMFRRRYIFHTRAALQRVQETCKCLFCPACIEEYDRGDGVHLKATRLFVNRVEDPMRVFHQLGHASCLRCGFEEFYPIPKQQYTPLDEALMTQQNAYLNQKILGQAGQSTCTAIDQQAFAALMKRHMSQAGLGPNLKITR